MNATTPHNNRPDNQADWLTQELKDFVGSYVGADHTLDGAEDNYASQKILHDHLINKIPTLHRIITTKIAEERIDEVETMPDRYNGGFIQYKADRIAELEAGLKGDK